MNLQNPNFQGKNKFLVIALSVFIGLLVITNGLTIYFIFRNKPTTIQSVVEKKIEKQVATSSGDQTKTDDSATTTTAESDSDKDGLTDAEEAIYKTDPNKADTDGDGFDDKVEIDNGFDPLVAYTKSATNNPTQIVIDWQKTPTEVSAGEFFKDYDFAKNLPSYIDYGGTKKTVDLKTFIDLETKFIKVGTISQGLYSGKDVYIMTMIPDGPSFRDTFYRLIKNDNEYIILTKQSDQPYNLTEAMFKTNDTISISNLTAPENIAINDSRYKLIKTKDEPMELFEEFQVKPLFAYNQNGDYVYSESVKNCFLIKNADSSVSLYYMELDFFPKKADTASGEHNPTILNVTWNNGAKNTNEYVSEVEGCIGAMSCHGVKEITDKSVLIATGKTPDGSLIYEIDSDLKDEQDQLTALGNMYESYNYDNSKESFEDFKKMHPIVYWENPFGDYFEFKRADIMPMAECGKPVIYLYPEKEQDVSVRVYPTGGFTYTEPVYDNGWVVRAKPNGEIYNYSDQQTYPYLFWEGKALDYQMPKKGFVVAKADIEKFLTEKLAQLGLVKNEYDEFIEFWLPRMQAKDFYFITFVPQAEFDKLAPLSVNPKPDTIIRVFMDFKGLDQNMEVEEQKISTPKRIGFTVVEWGGELRD